MKRRYNTRSSSKTKTGDQLPFDIVVVILTKLPAKSIARCRCLSKLYASTLRTPNFTDSFFTISSSSRPNILFTCLKDGETFFFSSPQPQNPSPVTASFHMKFSINTLCEMPRPVHGLVCGLSQEKIKGGTVTVPLICNPSTGQSFTLPKMRGRRKEVISYLGYDPIGKQFKILSTTPATGGLQHHVLTLGTGKKPAWRKIKCDIHHTPVTVDTVPVDIRGYQCVYDGVCINGVFYYLAYYDGFPDIVCFDIRSEKFDIIKRAEGMRLNSGALVNYKGGLARLQPENVNGIYTGCIQIWVLQDAQQHLWSSYTYMLPPPWVNIDWRNTNAETMLRFVGTTDRGEIVMSPNNISDSFYLLYYNPEMNTLTKVDVQGLEAFEGHKACIFLDHVEDVKLMESV